MFLVRPEEAQRRGTGGVLGARRRALWGGVSGAVVLIAAGFAAGSMIRSPAQLAADAKPPTASVLTAPVERRVLQSSVVVRGLVVAAQSLEITPSPTAGRPIATGVRVKVGDKVHSGQVLAEVAGRPLFVLLGAVPAYRDLRPGSEGTDVGQLQAALRDLGFADSDRAGYFGPKTKTAVVKFYSSIGFAAATTGGDDARAVRAAASALASARRDLDDAQRALATAKAAGDPTAIAAAQRAVDDANAAVTQARQEHDELVATTGPMVPLSELAFVAAMPARIDKLSATVGAAVTAPMIVISSGQLIVQASVTPADHELIKTGMAVVVTSELLGLTAEGTVDSVGELTTDSNGRSTYPVVVMPSTALDPRLAAQDVRVSVETARTAAEVLVVPLAAVSTNAVGVTTVSKWHTDGLVSAVEVRAGLSGGGFVEVTPVGGGSLQAGDQVVVGK